MTSILPQIFNDKFRHVGSAIVLELLQMRSWLHAGRSPRARL